MVSLTGNTSVYLQYAHARIRSILRKAGEPDDRRRTRRCRCTPPSGRSCWRSTSSATSCATSPQASEPHRLCNYLFDTAKAFTDFYENCPVLSAEEGVRANRLALCRLAATLHDGLGCWASRRRAHVGRRRPNRGRDHPLRVRAS